MKKIQFLTEKTQSKLLLFYIAISIIYFTIRISCFPWQIINPETKAEAVTSVLLGMIVFLILCLMLIGAFVKDVAKSEPKEENIQ